jgi:hypothetical protein
MAIDKRIFASPSGAWKGGMDKDTHERYVQNGFYRDARNVSFMINGSKFVLKNIKGNVELPYTFNEGDSMVIGAYDDSASRVAYVLVWNSLGNHEVLSVNYDVSELNVTQITQGAGLGFKFNNLITGIELVLGRFLYWVDDLTECVALDLENVPATITAANRYLIEAAKAPDPEPAIVRIGTDVTRDTNNLTKKVYKFRTRYRTVGGYRTSASTIAKVSTYQYDYMQFTGSDKVYYDNVIYVSIPKVDYENVTGIEVLIQSGNSDDTMGDWYLYKTVDPATLPQSIAFTGAEPLTALDNVEINEAYSFVPPTAKDVVLLPSNVIAWANITDNLDASNVEPKVNFGITNVTRPTSAVSATTTLDYQNLNSPITGVFENQNFNIKIDSGATFDSLTFVSFIQAGDVVSLSMNLSYLGVGDFATPKSRTIEFRFLVDEIDRYEIKSGFEYQLFNRRLFEYMSSVDTRYEGYGGIALHLTEDFIYLIQGENKLNSQFSVVTTVSGLSISVTQGYPSGSFPATVYTTRKSFKTNATHSFAVQYEDAKGRRTSAIPMGDIFIPTTGTYDEYPVLSTYIGHLAPTNAERYHVLYGDNKNYDEFLQLWVNAEGERAYIDITVNPENGSQSNGTVTITFDKPEVQRIYIDEAVAPTPEQIAALIATKLNQNVGIYSILTAYWAGTGSDEVILTGKYNDINIDITVEPQVGTAVTANINKTQTAGATQPQISEITNISGTNISSNSITGKEAWKLDIYTQIQSFISRYPNSGMEYNFVKGDRVRLIAYYDGAAPDYSISFDTEIISDDAYGVLISENLSQTPYNFTSGQNVLVEFYRPKTNLQDVFYHEIGVSGSVSPEGYHLAPNPSTDTDQTLSTPAIINLIDSGDVYYRFRATAFSAPTTTEFIEDRNISDFLPSACTDNGRLAVVDKLALKSVRRGTGIVYSQPIVNNTDLNGLAIVLGSSIQEYDVKYGNIQKVFLRMDRELVVFFEEKVGSVGVLSELVKQQNGDLNYATTAVLNNLNVFNYDGGIGTNPESFVRFENTCYFVSQKNNAVCRLQPQTPIIEISKNGMTSWFQDNMDVKKNYLGDSKFIGGYDERNGCYILSLFGYIKADSVTGDPTFPLVTFNKDKVFETGLDLASKSEMLILYDGTDYYTSRGILVNEINNNQAQISYSGAGIPIGDVFPEGWLRYRIETLWFNEEANSWMSFLDIKPEYMVTCGVDTLSFYDGSVWLNNENENRNTFFGEEVASTVDVVFNDQPQAIKMFQNIEQEALTPWKSNVDGDVNTLAGQRSLLEEAFYTEYQPNEWAAAFRQDTTTPNRDYPLLEGWDLRDKVLTVKLRNERTTDERLESVTVQYYPSDSSQ